MIKVPFEVILNPELITDENGYVLSTLRVKGMIHKYLPDDPQDRFFAFFFKYGQHIFYAIGALLICFFGASHLTWYFNSLFECFVIMVIDLKWDPATIENLRNALQPLVTLDFLGIMKPKYSNSHLRILESPGAAGESQAGIRLLQGSTFLGDRYIQIGIHDVFFKNVFMHLAIFAVALVMICVVKLVVSSNSPATNNSGIADSILKLKESDQIEAEKDKSKNEGKTASKESSVVTGMRKI